MDSVLIFGWKLDVDNSTLAVFRFVNEKEELIINTENHEVMLDSNRVPSNDEMNAFNEIAHLYD